MYTTKAIRYYELKVGVQKGSLSFEEKKRILYAINALAFMKYVSESIHYNLHLMDKEMFNDFLIGK